MAQKNINLHVLEEIVVHLPALKEQRAIATKIDSLIDLIRDCEQAQEQMRVARALLSRKAFAVLGERSDPFALEYLGELIRSPADVANLERSILNLAVRGQVVPQDPAEGSGRELLRRMKSGNEDPRAELATESEVATEEFSFEIPGSWAWSRVTEVTRNSGQKRPDRRFTYIDVSAVDGARGVITAPQVLEPADAPSRARKIVQPGSVIYSCVRPNLNNVALVEGQSDNETIASTAFAVLNPVVGLDSQFLIVSSCFWFSEALTSWSSLLATPSVGPTQPLMAQLSTVESSPCRHTRSRSESLRESGS